MSFPRKVSYDVTLLCERMAQWGPIAEEFAEGIRVSKRYPGPALTHILGLQLNWSADDVVKAVEHALKYDAYDARAVERILEARFRRRSFADIIAESTSGRIDELMRDNPVVQRELSCYETSAIRRPVNSGYARRPP